MTRIDNAISRHCAGSRPSRAGMAQIGFASSPSFARRCGEGGMAVRLPQGARTQRGDNLGRSRRSPTPPAGTRTRRSESCREYLVSRRIKIEDAEAAIKKYADGLPADTARCQVDGALRRRADAHERRSQDRHVWHRALPQASAGARQGDREGRHNAAAGRRHDTTGEQEPAGEIEKLSDQEEKYKWEVRVFQEKQANIPIACEIPQLMDERAGAIARAIRAQMKS